MNLKEIGAECIDVNFLFSVIYCVSVNPRYLLSPVNSAPETRSGWEYQQKAGAIRGNIELKMFPVYSIF